MHVKGENSFRKSESYRCLCFYLLSKMSYIGIQQKSPILYRELHARGVLVYHGRGLRPEDPIVALGGRIPNEGVYLLVSGA